MSGHRAGVRAPSGRRLCSTAARPGTTLRRTPARGRPGPEGQAECHRSRENSEDAADRRPIPPESRPGSTSSATSRSSRSVRRRTPRSTAGAFSIDGAVSEGRRWTWQEFRNLPREHIVRDIHCVHELVEARHELVGGLARHLLDGIEPGGAWISAWCDGGYTTNLPLAEVTGGKAWIVDEYDGTALAAEHGGPARLLVPHLYFWKSAKWVRGITVTVSNEPGFWEQNGYHDHVTRGRRSATGRRSGDRPAARSRPQRLAADADHGAARGDAASGDAAPRCRGMARARRRPARRRAADGR